MLESDSKRVIFLAFANDRSAGGQDLKNLPDEARRVKAALDHAELAGLCDVILLQHCTANDIFQVFRDTRYRNRIAIFHYAGHADGYGLLLETAKGEVAATGAKGFAEFLAMQEGLKLVFLNGCSTQQQAQGLLDGGVSLVITTSRSIDDAVATEFASQVYESLAKGAAIRTAFTEATAIIKSSKGDSPRGVYFGTQEAQRQLEAEGWPWSLVPKSGSEDVELWSLPIAAEDPLFGLPDLPKQDIPASPYRYLNWFRRKDADIFFGRGQQIRQLYTALTAPDSDPILLFYGQSGVGKSSILDAGLVPRLEQNYEVRYLRRTEAGLLDTLRLAFLPEAADVPIASAWQEKEKQLYGKPLIVFLDQVEELYTRPQAGGVEELTEFLRVVQAIFGDIASRPTGRLVLSFRKEWLSEFQTALRSSGLPFSDLNLEPLDRRGIVEVVRGPASSKRLQARYKLTIEDGLAETIAGDLLTDQGSAISSILQILLSKMWAQATSTNNNQPQFTIELYEALRREGILLSDFLKQQIAAFGEKYPDAENSGFLLDILAMHTTALGTADQCALDGLKEQYSHVPQLLAILQECQDLYLLTVTVTPQVDAPAMTRLAHDTLAPIVREQFDKSDKPGQRARRILDSRSIDWKGQQVGTPLDGADLTLVERGAEGTRALSPTERRLVNASLQLRARLRATRTFLALLGTSAVVAIVSLGLYARLQWNKTEDALAKSLISAVGHHDGSIEEIEMSALWDLATTDNERVRLRLFELGLGQPNTTTQIRRRSAYLVAAAVGLSSPRRDALRRLLLEKLRFSKSDSVGYTDLNVRATCIELGCALDLTDREFANACEDTFIQMATLADEHTLRDVARLLGTIIEYMGAQVKTRVAAHFLKQIRALSPHTIGPPPELPSGKLQASNTSESLPAREPSPLAPWTGRLAETLRIIEPYCAPSESQAVADTLCRTLIYCWALELRWHASGTAIGQGSEGYEGLTDLEWLGTASSALLAIQNKTGWTQLGNDLLPLVNAAVAEYRAGDDAKNVTSDELFRDATNHEFRGQPESSPRLESTREVEMRPPPLSTIVVAFLAISKCIKREDRKLLAIKMCHQSIGNLCDRYHRTDESPAELLPILSEFLQAEGRHEVAEHLKHKIRSILSRITEANARGLRTLVEMSHAMRVISDTSGEPIKCAPELMREITIAASQTRSPIRLRAVSSLLFLARDLHDDQSIQNLRSVMAVISGHCFSGSLGKDLQEESAWKSYPIDLHLYELHDVALLPKDLSKHLGAEDREELIRKIARFHRHSLSLLEEGLQGEPSNWHKLFTAKDPAYDSPEGFSQQARHLGGIAEAHGKILPHLSTTDETVTTIAALLRKPWMLQGYLAPDFVTAFLSIVDELPEDVARSCASVIALQTVRALIAERDRRRVWFVDSRWFQPAADRLAPLADRLDSKTRTEIASRVVSLLAASVRDLDYEPRIWGQLLEVGCHDQPAHEIAEILKHPAVTGRMRGSVLKSVAPGHTQFDNVWQFVSWTRGHGQTVNLDSVPTRPPTYRGEPLDKNGDSGR